MIIVYIRENEIISVAALPAEIIYYDKKTMFKNWCPFAFQEEL